MDFPRVLELLFFNVFMNALKVRVHIQMSFFANNTKFFQ